MHVHAINPITFTFVVVVYLYKTVTWSAFTMQNDHGL